MKNISSFRKSLFTLLTGSAFSQIILFGSSPLLTRLYEPSAFGQYAILSLFISLIVVFATGKYDIAIQLPKSNEDASALVWLAMTISTCVTVIIVSILMIGQITSGSAIWNVIGLNSPEFGIVFVLLVGASIFLTACQSTLFVWMNRQGAFKNISLARIVQAIVMVSIQILFSFLYNGVFGLLCGTVIGLASCLLFQLYFMLIERELLLRPKILLISRVAAEYSSLPVI
jgi:O-antigen/teichoic acid export membrane protein